MVLSRGRVVRGDRLPCAVSSCITENMLRVHSLRLGKARDGVNTPFLSKLVDLLASFFVGPSLMP